MKPEGKECCGKDMAKMMDHGMQGMKMGADPHAGHDMSGVKAPQAEPQKNN